jgi:hypothetical protein
MKTVDVSLPQLSLIAGTRSLMGAGVGLLLGELLSKDQRRAVGWTLVGVGVLTTIPLVATLISEFKTRYPRPTHTGNGKMETEPQRLSIGEEL